EGRERGGDRVAVRLAAMDVAGGGDPQRSRAAVGRRERHGVSLPGKPAHRSRGRLGDSPSGEPGAWRKRETTPSSARRRKPPPRKPPASAAAAAWRAWTRR